MKIEFFFRQIFRKILGYKIFMKIRPVGAELFRADGQTEMARLIVTFRNFCKRAHKTFGTTLLSPNKHCDVRKPILRTANDAAPV
jgi:hypothetical protein